jgi:hypothetical protein
MEKSRAGNVTLIECLPRTLEALGSIPSTTPKKKKKKKRGRVPTLQTQSLEFKPHSHTPPPQKKSSNTNHCYLKTHMTVVADHTEPILICMPDSKKKGNGIHACYTDWK